MASLPSLARGGYATWLVASAISWVFLAGERVYKLTHPWYLPADSRD